ncbi:response regulator [Marinobacterium stanieri]|uniref:response regulator n=1 Tax=Marinobacterium stanieri TaxID=49186 RepID=UPI0002558C14|nr:response regulator [Marinobacterium stanieri]
MTKHLAALSIGGFLLASILGLAVTEMLLEDEQVEQLEVRLSNEHVAYTATLRAQERLANTLFAEHINQPAVTSLIRRVTESSGDARDIARGLLFRQLHPLYLRLQQQGFRQFHFHTAEGKTLLRFHSPLNYDDELFDIRPSVKLANTEQTAVESFEMGRLFHGFRFVYPLFDGEQHLGSVELGVPFSTLEQELDALVENDFFIFALERDTVFAKLSPSQQSIYFPLALNEDFVVEDTGARMGHPAPRLPIQTALEQALSDHHGDIRGGMNSGEPFGMTHDIAGTLYAVLFLPVPDLSGVTRAYIITATQVPEIEALYFRGRWLQLLLVVMLAGLALLFYRKEQSARSTLNERNKLQAITERMAEGLFVQDTRGRITFINTAAQRTLGISEEEALGQIAHDLFHVHYGDDGKPVPIEQCPIRTTTARGQVYSSEDEYFRRFSDHELVPIQVTSAQLRVNEEDTGSITIFRDITLRKQYESQLVQARQEALQSTQAKSEFLANMSHEIRTPMNGILGMLELVLDADLPPEQKDYIRIANSSGQTLLALLNSILDLSKVEAGKMELEHLDFNLRETLEETTKLFAPQAQGKGLEIAALIDDSVPEYANGDPTRLRQVITNLLGNAIKFTDQGEITLAADVTQEADQSWRLHIGIRDTGIGIAADAQERIFEGFTQADGSTTRRYGGTGLGLTLSRRIATRMGGQIWLESTLDQGSTFHFTARLKPAKEPEALFIPNEDLRGLRALIVDDKVTNRVILQRFCDAWGIYHQSADSGVNALAKLELAAEQGKAFDCVLSDMMMPDMDGVEVARQIHANAQLGDLKLLLITSYTGRGLRDKARLAGFDRLLPKPIGRRELHDALEQVLLGPAQTPASAPASGALEHSATPGGLRILLAEDNQVNRQVASTHLEKFGCTVVSAKNGAEALERFCQQPFDLVLMDCQMPVMDGLEATRAIRQREGEQGSDSTPIIAMTAFSSEQNLADCRAAGMDGKIGKPFRPEALYQLLLEHTARKPVRSSFTEPEHPANDANTTVTTDTGYTILHQQTLDELNVLLDGEINTIIVPFMEQLPPLITQLRQALEHEDREALFMASHTLKSSAANVGGLEVSERARQLEAGAKTGAIAELETGVSQLVQATERLTQALATYTDTENEALES